MDGPSEIADRLPDAVRSAVDGRYAAGLRALFAVEAPGGRCLRRFHNSIPAAS